MQVYETTFIVNPQLEDAGIDQRVKEISDLIDGGGGKLLRTEHMGTRRLAYEINGLTQGYYGSFIYEAPGETPKSLERHFRMNDAYIRYLTVRFEGDPANIAASLEVRDEHGDDRHYQRPSGPPVGQRRPEQAPSHSAPTAPRPEAKPQLEEKPEAAAEVKSEAASEEKPVIDKNDEPEQL